MAKYSPEGDLIWVKNMRSDAAQINFNGRHKITFFDKNYQSNSKIDNNLGYIIGFREPEYISDDSITSEAVGDTYGTKYFLLHIDDFNQNQMNTNIIGASNIIKNIVKLFFTNSYALHQWIFKN